MCQETGTAGAPEAWMQRERGRGMKDEEAASTPDDAGLRGLGKDSRFYSKWVEGYKQDCDKFWTWYLKDHSGWSVAEEWFLKVLSQPQMSNFFPVILGSHELVAWARKRMYSPH